MRRSIPAGVMRNMMLKYMTTDNPDLRIRLDKIIKRFSRPLTEDDIKRMNC